MRRKSAIFIFVIVCILTAAPAASAYAAGIGVAINQQPVMFTQDSGAPFIDQASRTQVPFRAAMEAFGCTVNWDGTQQTAIAEKDGIIVKVPIGKPYILRNDQQIPCDTSALIKDNRTYLPIRAVLEAFGASVSWDSGTQTVLVATAVSSPGAISGAAVTTAAVTTAAVTTTTADPNSQMKIYFLDVGQADSIFIDFNSYEILVDGGNNADGSFVVNYIKPYVDGDLELMIGTHAHEDHIGGLDNVLTAYQVDRIIYSDETSTTASFNDFYKAAAAEPGASFTGDSDLTFDMGHGAEFRILEMGDGYETPNENSVISMIDYQQVSVLLMGDLESTVEKSNLNKFSDIDVLKVGHHGSRTASSQAFLDVVKPEVSIISAGIDNQYRLPNAEIITRLIQVGSTVYGTFRSGTIVMTTDGTDYQFNTDVKLNASDGGALSAAATSSSAAAIQSSGGSTVSESEAVYIGNANTMKFHTADCSAGAKIADRNIVYFKTREEAIAQGYVPCKLCNP